MAFVTKSTISFSIALFATSILVSATAAPAPTAALTPTASPFCVKATDKALCNQIVHGSTIWSDVMTNGLRIAMRKIRAGKPLVDSIGSKMPGDMWTISRDSIVDVCNRTYDNMIYETHECMRYVKSPGSYKWGPEIEFGVVARFTDCQDAMKEFNVTLPEVDNFINGLDKIASELISIGETQPADKP